MIFHELYSAYYTAVDHILARAVSGTLTQTDLRATVEAHAFAESAPAILPALREGRWPLLLPDLTTPLTHPPTRPLTTLERRWLKSITLDPRVALFDLKIDGLDDVKPLFTPADYRIFDQSLDGDPYTDSGYIARFRLILDAIRNRYPLSLATRTRKGNRVWMHLQPERLEYSAKDDKFRLISTGCRYGGTVNLGRIIAAMPYEYTGRPFRFGSPKVPVMLTATLTIFDARNTLERAMLHFAHFEKQAERLGTAADDNHYRLMLRYDRNDETELLIRILSFGPFLRVESPDSLVEAIRARLSAQRTLGLK